jgi:nitrous oxidase accessory protein NosD
MKTRLLSIGAIAALAAGLLATPASAAGATRWVDKDGSAGPNGCSGTGTAFTTIGAALDAAVAGDTVRVCAGRYKEQVTIDTPGVTLISAKPWQARIAPTSPGGGAIVTVAAKNVTVQWLKIVAPTFGACTSTGQGILIDGAKNARIVSNRVLANPNGDTFDGPCVLVEGISVDDGSEAAVVTHNIVRNFTLVGIIIHNADAQVINNSVQYWHQPCGTAQIACRKAPQPALPQIPTGIRIYQSTAIVDLNAITSGPVDDLQVVLEHGISTSGVDGVKIRKNDIRLVDYGMWLETSDNLRVIGNVVVGPTPPTPTRTRSRVAPASYARSGILAWSGTGSRFANNKVLHNQAGLDLSSQTTGATVTGNDLTGNGIDCLDNGGNPANTWTDNLGNTDYPDGLCTDAPIQAVPGSPT